MKLKTIINFFSSKKGKNDEESDTRRINQKHDRQATINKLRSGGYEEPTEPVRRYCKSMPDRDFERENYRPAVAYDDTCRPINIEPPRKQRRSCSVQQPVHKVHYREDEEYQGNIRDSMHHQMQRRANQYKEKMERVIFSMETKDSEIRHLKEKLKKREKREQLLRKQLDETNNKINSEFYEQQKMMQYMNMQNEQLRYQQGLWDHRPPSAEQQAYNYPTMMPTIYSQQRTNYRQLSQAHYGGPMHTGNNLATNSYQWLDRNLPGSSSTPLPTEGHSLVAEAADTPSSMAFENNQPSIDKSLHIMKTNFGRTQDDEDEIKEFTRHSSYSEETENDDSDLLNCDLHSQLNI